MESNPVASRALPEFCAAVIERHAPAWPPTEEQLAQDLLAHVGITRVAHYGGLVEWLGEVGVALSTMELPHDLRGFNYWHENAMSIVMPINGGCFVSREHTLLHELRELLEDTFRNLGYPIAPPNILESRAERFAVCVRTAVVLELSKGFFEIVRGARDPLGRVCGYALVGAVTAVLALGCAGIRHLEVHFDSQRSNVRT